MSIQVEHNPGDWEGLENCAICRALTAYWTALPNRSPGEQVARCQDCAAAIDARAVPTKEAWFKATQMRMVVR